MVRRTFTREFKQEAVKLVTCEGLKPTEAARNLGVKENTLRNWLAKEQEGLLDPSSAASQELAEIKRLKKELRLVRMERDILKKATAFFASLEK